jgi:hypothetical protein
VGLSGLFPFRINGERVNTLNIYPDLLDGGSIIPMASSYIRKHYKKKERKESEDIHKRLWRD